MPVLFILLALLAALVLARLRGNALVMRPRSDRRLILEQIAVPVVAFVAAQVAGRVVDVDSLLVTSLLSAAIAGVVFLFMSGPPRSRRSYPPRHPDEPTY